jgi:hypothetical protein
VTCPSPAPPGSERTSCAASPARPNATIPEGRIPAAAIAATADAASLGGASTTTTSAAASCSFARAFSSPSEPGSSGIAESVGAGGAAAGRTAASVARRSVPAASVPCSRASRCGGGAAARWWRSRKRPRPRPRSWLVVGAVRRIMREPRSVSRGSFARQAISGTRRRSQRARMDAVSSSPQAERRSPAPSSTSLAAARSAASAPAAEANRSESGLPRRASSSSAISAPARVGSAPGPALGSTTPRRIGAGCARAGLDAENNAGAAPMSARRPSCAGPPDPTHGAIDDPMPSRSKDVSRNRGLQVTLVSPLAGGKRRG